MSVLRIANYMAQLDDPEQGLFRRTPAEKWQVLKAFVEMLAEDCRIQTAASTPPAQQDAQAINHIPDAREMVSPTYGSEEIRKLRETIQSMARIIRDYEAAPTPPARSVEAQAVRDGIDAAINFLESGDDYEVKRKIMAAALRCSGLIFDLWWRAAPTPPAQP